MYRARSNVAEDATKSTETPGITLDHRIGAEDLEDLDVLAGVHACSTAQH
jgi:hypothetical protein